MFYENSSAESELSESAREAFRGYLRDCFDIEIGDNAVAVSITGAEAWFDTTTGDLGLEYSVRSSFHIPVKFRFGAEPF